MNLNFNSASARRNMIRQQVRCQDVTSQRVLDAMLDVPRELFVDEKFTALAFADTGLPLGTQPREQQTMMPPTLAGRVLQCLDILPSERVLEIGTGSGYLTACLAQLANFVTSIDIDPVYVERATARLADLGISNVEVKVQDVFTRAETAQFDAIVVAGSLRTADARFTDWLAPGGRAFIAIGSGAMQEAVCITRTQAQGLQRKSLFETFIAPLSDSTRNSASAFNL